MRLTVIRIAAIAAVLCPALIKAEEPDRAAATVPRLVRLTGSFHPANGLPVGPSESATLSIYREEQGGQPLWQETQNVTLDSDAHYTAVLGITQKDGIPVDLFSATEPRWLGVQFNRPGEVEQPRVQLVSVPYALKASDAETLGGRPASAYLLNPDALASTTGSNTATSAPAALPDPKSLKPHQTQTMNYIPYFIDTMGGLANSVVYQNASNIGIGTTAPTRKLDVLDASSVFQMRFSTGSNEGGLGADGNGFFRVVGTGGGAFGTGSASQSTFNEVMRIFNGRVGIGATAPARKLDLVDASSPFQLRLSTGSSEGGLGTDGNGFFRMVGTIGGAFGTGSVSQGTFNEVMRMINGNIGIGVAAPARKLDVVDASSAFQMRFSTGSNEGGLGTDANGFFRVVGTGGGAFGTGSASQGTFNEVMRIYNGRVGIGVASPAFTLDVAGGGQFTASSGNLLQGASGGNTVFSIDSTGLGTFNGGVSATGVNIGVLGSTGNGFGVQGQASGTGTGVWGIAVSSSGVGVRAQNSSQAGVGLWVLGNGGTAANGGTVAKFTDQTGNSNAILLLGNSGTGCISNTTPCTTVFTVDSSGNLTISGTLTAATKHFKIDDPLDPEHKALYHASIESSEMVNLYSGNVILDRKGQAVIRMPEWFEALNTDFRYQLTTIGRSAPVFIAHEIQNHEFKIAGGRAGMKVSWQVTGVRHDSWAQEHPMRVEEMKEAVDK